MSSRGKGRRPGPSRAASARSWPASSSTSLSASGRRRRAGPRCGCGPRRAGRPAPAAAGSCPPRCSASSCPEKDTREVDPAPPRLGHSRAASLSGRKYRCVRPVRDAPDDCAGAGADPSCVRHPPRLQACSRPRAPLVARSLVAPGRRCRLPSPRPDRGPHRPRAGRADAPARGAARGRPDGRRPARRARPDLPPRLQADDLLSRSPPSGAAGRRVGRRSSSIPPPASSAPSTCRAPPCRGCARCWRRNWRPRPRSAPIRSSATGTSRAKDLETAPCGCATSCSSAPPRPRAGGFGGGGRV